ncbi:hypothetical protein LUZ60_003035 [Juncus effusus]|nr:hypothetical protein LUZ60_003035 [Juncus effusus]
MDIHSELRSIPKVLATLILSLTYSRFISAQLRPGLPRLLSLLPAISLLPLLPFLFSTIHFRVYSAFFLAWLCFFKLLLLSFGHGPLDPSLSLISFISLASLPVKLLTNTTSLKSLSFKSPKYLVSTAIKAGLFASLLSLYRFNLHPFALHLIHCIHAYLSLELILSTGAIMAGLLLNMELEPQFNQPYLATSLCDFWGRRWNLMVSSILRPSVFNPLKPYIGCCFATIVTFVVSGIMHEFLFYYITLLRPNGQAILFFVLHGFCTAFERWWAKHERWWRPCEILGRIGTLGFVTGTGVWLFFPAMLRGDVREKGQMEIKAMIELFSGGVRT